MDLGQGNRPSRLLGSRAPRWLLLVVGSPMLVALSTCVTPVPSPGSPSAQSVISFALRGTVDAEHGDLCQFVRVPSLAVRSVAIRFSGPLTAVLVSRTSHVEIPTWTGDGGTADASAPFRCSDSAASSNLGKTGYLVVAPLPEGAHWMQGLPNGVALVTPPGVLLIQLHALLEAAAEVSAVVELETTPTPTIEAGLLVMSHFFVDVPPHERARARMACPVLSPVSLAASIAVTFHGESTVWTAAGGEIRGVGRSQARIHGPPRAVPAGTKIDILCELRNDADGPLMFPRERCALLALYYPRDPSFELCGPDFAHQQQAADYFFDGGADCGRALDCLLIRVPLSYPEARACVVRTCAASSASVSAALRCAATSDCKDRACVERQCAAEVAACRLSGC